MDGRRTQLVSFVLGLAVLLGGLLLMGATGDGPPVAQANGNGSENENETAPVVMADWAVISTDLAPVRQPQQTTMLHVQTSSPLLRIGDTLVVTVTASDVESPLSAFQFDLVYNPSVLAYVGGEYGDFLASTGRSVTCPDAVSSWGMARMACASTGAETGPIGDGVLAVLTFQAISNGQSDLALENVQLPDTSRPPALQTATTDPASVLVCIPAQEVSITGPPTGTAGISVTFTATVNPVSGTATLPVTFTWQASGQTTLTHYDALTDTATFTWTTAGTQAVTVTIANECGGSTASHSIAIETAEQHIFLPLIMRNAGSVQASVLPASRRSRWARSQTEPLPVRLRSETWPNGAAGGSQSRRSALAYLAMALGLGVVFFSGNNFFTSRRRVPWQKIFSVITLINLLGGLLPLPVDAGGASAYGNSSALTPLDHRNAISDTLSAISDTPSAMSDTLAAVHDLDSDHDVDFNDLSLAAAHWNCASGQGCYDADLDFGGLAGRIDAYDLAAIGNEYDIAPPELTITVPEEESVTGGNSVQVSGLVTDTHDVTVIVNGVEATIGGGAFVATVPITAGNFLLSVVAEDALGAVTTADRLVFVDQEGPFIVVGEPANRQAVYTLQPTVVLTYTDFYTAMNTATLQVTLTDEDGQVSDITAGLTVGAEGAAGQVSASLAEDTVYTLTATMEDVLGNVGTVRTTFY
ncbi:MAG: hypothetical protein DRI48_09145, partial [Chloroflexi bacterium]